MVIFLFHKAQVEKSNLKLSRSNWKALFRHPQAIESLSDATIVIQNRATFISESIVNRTCKVYNGIRWIELFIIKEIVGNCVGQYAPTRKRPVHKKLKVK